MGCATVVLRRTESPNYIDLEQRVRADPPLPVVRQIAYVAPKALFGEFDKIAKEALDRIGQPYAVEKTINGTPPDRRQQQRQILLRSKCWPTTLARHLSI
jgi:hypothetical protein